MTSIEGIDLEVEGSSEGGHDIEEHHHPSKKRRTVGWLSAGVATPFKFGCRVREGYLSCRCLEIITTLEISLGILAGPASMAVRVNRGDPDQPGSLKRSKGWTEAVLLSPCSGE
jgi:hypothetical protein